MNVYDFDNTIYNGDSSIDFYLFNLKKNIKLIKYLPKQIKSFILYKIKKIKKEQLKETFFVFLNDINIEKRVEEFWNVKEKNIKKWYLMQKKENDVIISASPEFLLKPICKKLKLHNLICSKLNINTLKIQGNNCKGIEKVKRFNKKFKNVEITSKNILLNKTRRKKL